MMLRSFRARLKTLSWYHYRISGGLVLQAVNRSNPKEPLPGASLPAPPGGLFRVIIKDNDYNTYQQVMEICMEALSIGTEDAYRIALAVDHNGEAEVLQGPRSEADRVATIIRRIGIEVLVTPVQDGERRSPG